MAAAWLLAGPPELQAQSIPAAGALPVGPQVVSGQAQIMTRGRQMTVTNTPGAVLNWRSFDIGASAGVHFQQADPSSKVLNRVTGQDPSAIFGSLTSNGQVWLLNPNGVLFGKGARVDVAGLVASTLRLNDVDFLKSRLSLVGDGAGAGVRNEGRITTPWGGQVLLLGEQVFNSGEINTPGGSVTLAAARSVDLVDTGMPNLAVRLGGPAAEVLNLGRVLADGGAVDIFGGAVNQQGLVRADTLSSDAQGRIVLRATDTLTLGPSSVTQSNAGSAGLRGGQIDLLGHRVALLGNALVDASGTAGGGSLRLGGGLQGRDASVPNAEALWFGPQATVRADATGQHGEGGRIILWSDRATRAYGTLSARGGSVSGDGGFVETSGGWLDARPAHVDVSSRAGRAGQWLLDPNDIFIVDPGNAVDTSISSGPTFTSTGDSSILTTSTIAAALNAGTSVTVQTGSGGGSTQAGDIVMTGTLNVAPTAPVSLTLAAFRDVLVTDSTIASTGSPLSLNLVAGAGPVGAIEISGSTITTAGGDVTLRGARAQQMPMPDGTLTSATFNAAVGYDPSIQELATRLLRADVGVHVSDSRIDAGAGRFSATGLGLSVEGGVVAAAFGTSPGVLISGSVFDSTVDAARIDLQGWGVGSAGQGVAITTSELRATQSVNVYGAGKSGGIAIVNAGVHLDAVAGSGATMTMTGIAGGNGFASDGLLYSGESGIIVVPPGEGNPRPTLVIEPNPTPRSLSAANASVSLSGRTDGLNLDDSNAGLRVDGGALLDFSAATSVQLTGEYADGTGVGIFSSSVQGPLAGPMSLTAQTGQLLIDLSGLSSSGTLSLSGSTVAVLGTTINAVDLPLHLSFDTPGASPGGVYLRDTGITTAGGDVTFGASQLLPGSESARPWVRSTGVDGAAALTLELTQIDAGSGTIRGGGVQLGASGGGGGLSISESALTGSVIDLAGRGSASGGHGLSFVAANFTAANIGLSGVAGGAAHGVVGEAGTDPQTGLPLAGSTLNFTNLTLTGTSPGNSTDHAGVTLGPGVSMVGGNRGTALISGDTVRLAGDAASDVSLTGDLASVQVLSTGSMSIRRASLDFSGGAGTSVSLVADSDSSQGGRVTLSSVQVDTGGGAFSAGGAGVPQLDASSQPVPQNQLVRDGPEGILFSGFVSINTGGASLSLTGRGASVTGTGQEVGTGVLIAGSTLLTGGAVTIDGRAQGAGVGVDAGLSQPETFLEISASSINVIGQGAGTGSNGVANPGIGLGGGAWQATGNINLSATGPMVLSFQSFDAGGSITLSAAGAGGGAAVLRARQSSFTAADAVSITGASTDGSIGAWLGSATPITGSSISITGTGGGLAFEDADGSTAASASNGPIILTGRTTGTGPGVAVSGGWNFTTPGSITVNSDNAPALTPGTASLQNPSFAAGGAFTLDVFSPTGLTLASGPFPLLDGAALAAALSGHGGDVNLRVQGNPNALTVDGSLAVNGRLNVQADGITLQAGSQLASAAAGDAIVLRGASQPGAAFVTNNGTASVLSAANGRWVVLVEGPSTFTAGGLVPDVTEYGLATKPWVLDGSGNYVTPLGGKALGYMQSTEQASGSPFAAVASKVYDATTAIVLDPATWTLSGLVTGDQLRLQTAPTGTLVDKNAGQGRPVNLSSALPYSIVDVNGNPVFGYPTLAVTANVTPATLTASGTVVSSKVYDGTTSATFSAVGSVTPLGGDSVTLVAGTGTFSDRNVGTGKSVTTTGFSLSGADASNYVLQPLGPLQADITARLVGVSGLGALNKVYDTTVQATVTGTAQVSGAVQGDAVSLSGTVTGAFVDRNVGTGKTVNLAGLSLTGADAGNYTLQLAPVQADITPAPVVVTGLSALSRVYDGTTAATLTGTGSVAPLGNDSLGLGGSPTASFADRNAGTGKPVTVTGLTLTGADAGNYALQSTVLSADITPAALALLSLSASNRVYDGTRNASIAFTTAAPLAGDVVGIAYTGQFADANAGSGKTVSFSGSLSGPAAANYVLATPTGTTTATITPASLTYTATPAVGVAGQALPTLSGTIDGFVGGDTQASATTGTLSWSTSATAASPAGQYDITGGGLAAVNYTFAQSAGNATALTLETPVLNDPVTPLTVVALSGAIQSVQLPVTMSTPQDNRVLDVTPLMGVGGAFAAPPTALQDAAGGRSRILAAAYGSSGPAPGPGAAAGPGRIDRAPAAVAPAVTGAASFAALDWARLTRDEAQNLLAARGRYKRNLFEPAIRLLQQDSSQADLPPCRDPDQVDSGDCMVTEDLKRRIQATAQMRQLKEGQRRVRQAELPRIERKQALLIGVNAYDDKRVPELVGAVTDARAVRDLLERRLGYETTIVENPTRRDIVRAFNRLALQSEPNDSVVVYFAGHGVLAPIKGVETGFWLPSDSDARNPGTWLSNNDIAKLLATMGSSQTMLISDSCYSGSLVGRDRVVVAGSGNADDLLSRRAAVVMSSGGEEPVADEGKDGHSVFAWHLMQTLTGLERWQPGNGLFDRLRVAVTAEFPQTPQYGASRAIGHQGNTDYLFERRELEPAKP